MVDSLRTATEHIVRETIETVNQAVGSPSTSRGRRETRHSEANGFTDFAANVIGRAEVPMGVLLVTLVYIHRSRPHLSIEAEDWALHRIFLGALIIASKVCVLDHHPTLQKILTRIQFTNDSTLQNVHWAITTRIFGKRDVGRIEREFLDVLDWDLTVSENEVADLYPSIIALYPRAQSYAAVSPSRPTRCPTFTLDPISDDSDDSSSSVASSPRTPEDSKATTQFVKYDPSECHDFHHMQQSPDSQPQWSKNQKLIAALASEHYPSVAA
jgi:hypothetical protein